MIVWIAAGLLVAAAAIAAGPPKLTAQIPGSLLDLFPPPGPAGTSDTGDREYDGAGQWQLTGAGSCPRADDLLIPTPESLGVPQEAIQLGGPIAAAIVGGIDIVNGITKALGWRRRCAVRGGQYVLLGAVQGATVRVWALVEIMLDGHPPTASWVYDETITHSGEVTERAEQTELVGPDYAQSEAHYLRHGGEPPSHWWPHGMGIQKYQHLLQHPQMTGPRLDAVRAGDDLRVYAWLPPRVPASHVNALGQRIVDAPAVWRVRWVIEAV